MRFSEKKNVHVEITQIFCVVFSFEIEGFPLAAESMECLQERIYHVSCPHIIIMNHQIKDKY